MRPGLVALVFTTLVVPWSAAAAVTQPSVLPARGHWYTLEASWSNAQHIHVELTMNVPPYAGAEESYFFMGNVGAGWSTYLLTSTGGPVAPRATVADQSVGVQYFDTFTDAAGQHETGTFECYTYCSEGNVRFVGFSLDQPVTFTASADSDGALSWGGNVGDGTFAIRTGDFPGTIVSTSVATMTRGGSLAFPAGQDFFGTICPQLDNLTVYGPSGNQVALARDAALSLTGAQPGTWTVHLDPTTRVVPQGAGLNRGVPEGQTVYVQGAIIPRLGIAS